MLLDQKEKYVSNKLGERDSSWTFLFYFNEIIMNNHINVYRTSIAVAVTSLLFDVRNGDLPLKS